jgi:putative oxidoreductase
MNVIYKIHALLATLGRWLQCPLLLVIRLYWGWQFFIDGKGKLQNLDKVTAYFASLHIPEPRLNVIVAASIQCLCGLLLMAGLFARFASLPLIGVMCVAYATAESAALHSIFSNPDKFVTADPFLFLFAAVIVFAFGPGKISIDAIIFKDTKS